ncbi:GumC family protein [Gelidibacter japonicus]|uniref:GumC family protein n=1 Tax=Gelidibacter japonicus TaxID=1962232 RepID=UPI003A8F6B6F
MASAKKIDLLDVATTFAKRKNVLVKIVCITTIIGTVIAFLLPKIYESEVTFIVTEGNSINFSGGGLLSGLANLSGGGSNISPEQTLILLRSTVIQDKVIEKFNLKEVFGQDIPEAVRKQLNDKLIITDARAGGLGFNSIVAITITYKDKDPELAYDIVQYYYSLLDATIQDLNRKGVSDGYLMLKTRLTQNEYELEVAEDSLVSFQKRYGVMDVQEQAVSQIKNLAELKSEIVKLEIQIGYTMQTLGVGNNKIENLKIQKKQVEKKYNELLTGDSLDSGSKKETFDVFKSAKDMPDLFLEYLRRYREVVIQEEIYKVLYPQFEQQKLNFEEANSGLRIIDPAIIPTYKSGPKRAFIMIAAFLFGCFLSILIILYKEWKEHLMLNDVDEYNRFEEFTKALKKFK